MKQKLSLIFLILLIALAIIALLSLVITRFSRQTQPIIVIPTPTLAPIPLKNLPTTERIEVVGISVKNPYTSTVQLTAQGDSLMVNDPSYRLVYLKPFNKFLITITSSPFEENRQKGEKALLERLDITRKEACSLPVEITTTEDVNPQEAGQIYGLSFCQ